MNVACCWRMHLQRAGARHVLALPRFKHAILPQMLPSVQVTFWTAEDVDLSHDPSHWQELETGEQSFISSALGYLAASGALQRQLSVVCLPAGLRLPCADTTCWGGWNGLLSMLDINKHMIAFVFHPLQTI